MTLKLEPSHEHAAASLKLLKDELAAEGRERSLPDIKRDGKVRETAICSPAHLPSACAHPAAVSHCTGRIQRQEAGEVSRSACER